MDHPTVKLTMSHRNTTLIIPVENQVRELEPKILTPYLSSWTGPLASERITEGLVGMAVPGGSVTDRLRGWQHATRRRLVKKSKGCLPGSKYRPEFQRHRYPGLTLEEMQERVRRFQCLLGDEQPLRVKRLRDHIYRITA